MKREDALRKHTPLSKSPAPVEMQRRAFPLTVELCQHLHNTDWTRAGWKAEVRQFCNDHALIELRQLHGELEALQHLAQPRAEFKIFAADVLRLDRPILTRAWLSPWKFLAAVDTMIVAAAEHAQDDLLFV